MRLPMRLCCAQQVRYRLVSCQFFFVQSLPFIVCWLNLSCVCFFFLLFIEADLVAAAATGGDAAFDALSAMRVGKN